ncbi:MAG: hypothetical protein ABJM06_10755 [Gilvibacter sp.]
MKIFITLDYELFFGSKSGSVQKCIIEPTEQLLRIVDPLQIKLGFFVDTGYLMALERQKDQHPSLQKDYDLICGQIRAMSQNGHSIQLHVHPHWEDTFYNGQDWDFKTTRYKLADFTDQEVLEIVTRYNDILGKISGSPSTAYRAGGWSAQPWEPIGIALAKNNIFLDSTVFPGGYYQSAQQQYDFRAVAPFTTEYKFSEDLAQQSDDGPFVEIPISAHRVSPVFFWRFVWIKLFGSAKHKPYGDGFAISKEGNDIFRLLTRFSNSVVSMDGFKASYLGQAFAKYKKHCDDDANFVIIGHPKAFTPYSIQKLKQFIDKTHKQHEYKAM